LTGYKFCRNFVLLFFRKSKDIEADDPKDELYSKVTSTGSVHLIAKQSQTDVQKVPSENDSTTAPMLTNDSSQIQQNGKENRKTKGRKEKDSDGKKKKKWLSFSILKDVRFLTLCIAQFIFTLPSSGLFLPALAKSRGLADIQAAYLLSIIAGSDTVFRVVSGFVMDLKVLRSKRAFIYNGVTYAQCIPMFLIPSCTTFEQFAGVCTFHGALMGRYFIIFCYHYNSKLSWERYYV